MRFVAAELREHMAALGFRTIAQMVGRTDMLRMEPEPGNPKTALLDYSRMLGLPEVPKAWGRHKSVAQEHSLENSLDRRVLMHICEPALLRKEKVAVTLPIRNSNRVVGTILGWEVTKRYGAKGLPADTIKLKFVGSAGQSFGAFLPPGISMTIEGDSNDHLGKGLSGGKIVVLPPQGAAFKPEENIIIGNVGFYGATSGEAYIRGMAGERFCVRNSGVSAVVEGVGDHGCEYMTGGRVVILGATGRNFAAGMSGGIAYVYDTDGNFPSRCNAEMVDLEDIADPEDMVQLKTMIEQHVLVTGSTVGRRILSGWAGALRRFVKVMPRDYRRMLEALRSLEAEGVSGNDALMAAFKANHSELARVSGN
jgi:glutamate synthase (ferredoxin)